MRIENAEIARLFRELADLLEIEGANPFRVRAYRTAARTAESHPDSLSDLAQEHPERLTDLPGIGDDLAGKIVEISRTGRLEALEETGRHLPRGLPALMRLPGLGPRKVQALFQQLGVQTPAQLGRALQEGRVTGLKGFGPKTEARLKAAAPRYQKAKKKAKGKILNEFLELTYYTRNHAAYMLRTYGRKVWINTQTLLVSDSSKKKPRNKEKVYDDMVIEPLKKIWKIMDYICGKRLAPMLKEVIPRLLRFREIRLEQVIQDKLMKISPATIDRLLASERKKHMLKGRSNTKPGTLLKSKIPIRTSQSGKIPNRDLLKSIL